MPAKKPKRRDRLVTECDLLKMERRINMKLSELSGRLATLATDTGTILEDVKSIATDPNVPADAEASLVTTETNTKSTLDALAPTPPPATARRGRV